MKRIGLCASMIGTAKENVRQSMRYTEYALRCGTTPVVSHFYRVWIDGGRVKDRDLMLAAEKSPLLFCEELWVFGEAITPGMWTEIHFFEDLKRPVRYIPQYEITKKLGGEFHEQNV